MADFEAATGTCFGRSVGMMGRLQDWSALKCWWWIWRICNYGVDAVFDGSERHVDSGCRFVAPIFAKAMANVRNS